MFIVKYRESGRPCGFAFVSMETPEEMNAAVEGLNGEEFAGRAMTINEARPCEERPQVGGYNPGADRRGRGGYGGGDRGCRGGDRGVRDNY